VFFIVHGFANNEPEEELLVCVGKKEIHR